MFTYRYTAVNSILDNIKETMGECSQMARHAVRGRSHSRLSRAIVGGRDRANIPRRKEVTEWSVTLGFEHAIPADQATDTVDDLLEVLAPAHAAARLKGRALRVQLTVKASSMRSAMDKALTLMQEALRAVGIRTADIYAATAETMEELAREQEAPNYPDLVGVAELAALLDVTRQRASELARAGRGFPRPIAFLASGPVWDKTMIARYVAGWERRPGGRPKKTETVPT